MRSRALVSTGSAPPSGGLRRASPAALVFLRGRDADGRLREIGAARSAARSVLGALAGALRDSRAHEALGYRSLGDYARELDRRLRAAIAFLQTLDLETCRILRQVLQRRLFSELGLESFARYCEERLDLSPRTAGRLVALSRAEHRAPAVATAFRHGEIHAFQAHALLRVAGLTNAQRWVKRAPQVTLRRLEDDVGKGLRGRSALLVVAQRLREGLAAKREGCQLGFGDVLCLQARAYRRELLLVVALTV